ncbi:hypothetical protein H1230_23500 [Paenibacillus sp. 19GGS1-52]|uniref:copper amine oxidase N-terminal domain-containing protein n=1 Tax=Paenibacillus sp. 19GGS1-52 TaxID=2758563 RepID=UPI001EFAB519|nr:copper amine oxidase N-terminal domain-containing protein [Paenibacillus sp. 19GGS1-52]ULO05985.1 hypothetical protein H1230_23500 [Paenibacillus sp. 19GGS1-52]
MKIRNRIKTMLLLALTISVLLGTYGGLGNAQAANTSSPVAIKQSVPLVEIAPSVWSFDTKHTNIDFFINKGITYVSYKQAAAVFQDLVWSFDQKSGNLQISGPNRTLSWKVNTTTAMLNGKTHPMSAAMMNKNGSLSIPLRDLVNWSGGSLSLYSNHIMTLSYKILNVVAGNSKGWYWVRKDNGLIYTAVGSGMPHNIGQSAVRANQYAAMTLLQADTHTVVLQVIHNYGEPSLGNDLYKLLIYNGKLIRESAVGYYGGSPVNSIAQAEGLTVMLNDTELLLVRSNGTVQQRFDLNKLGGLDEVYTVEYASVKDGILLIRPFESRTLLLIDPKLDSPVVLYKELLSKEEQVEFEKWEKNPTMPPREGLQFVKREGQTFTFTHTGPTGEVTEGLTYTLAN